MGLQSFIQSLTTLDWIAIGLTLFAVLLCTIRGFVKSVIGVAKFVGAVLLAKAFSPLLGGFFEEKIFAPKIYSWLAEKISALVGGISDSMNLSQLFTDENSSFAVLLKKFGAEGEFENLKATYGDAVNATESTLYDLAKSIAEPFVRNLSIALAAILIFIVSMIVLAIVGKILAAIVEKIPFVGGLNHLLGFALGLFTGCAAIAAFVYVYNIYGSMLSVIGISSTALGDKINESVLFQPIYQFVMSLKK